METISKGTISGPPGQSTGSGGAGAFSVTVDPRAKRVTLGWGGVGQEAISAVAPQTETSGKNDSPSTSEVANESKPVEKKEFSMLDVAEHKTKDDCWVVVNGRVLDVTGFLSDHPG